MLVADGDQHDLILAVLVRLVAEPNCRRFAALLQLIGEHGRVEIEHLHGGRSLSVRLHPG